VSAPLRASGHGSISNQDGDTAHGDNGARASDKGQSDVSDHGSNGSHPGDSNNGDRLQAPHEAQLLILDEPTASLDVQSEYEVYSKFHELTAGKSALLISHRFSTVRMADRILVLENGKIVEEGHHDELIATDSMYARLFNLQADRYK
jgi:hypothetical protein